MPKADEKGILKTVEIRTDFVPFTAAKGANSVLLIYSILDSSVGSAKIISGFR